MKESTDFPRWNALLDRVLGEDRNRNTDQKHKTDKKRHKQQNKDR